MSEIKIPAGYKQTEVGLIPEDWEVKKLRDISPSISVGLVINPSSYFDKEGTVPMLVGSNIKENIISWESANCISESSNLKVPASRLYADDLVTVRVGEPGITAVIPPELDNCNCASVMIVRKSDRFNSHWLCFSMNSRIGISQIENVQYGTAQKQFNISDAVNFVYPTPSLKEQTAIATVLSDVDALIASINAQIAKKCDIKTATMQQLLTGKQRLTGFGEGKSMKSSELGEIPEDWEVVPLSGMVDIRDGTHASPKYKTEGIPLVTSKNLVGRIIDLSNASLISTEDADEINKRSKVHKGDILMSMIGTIGSAILVKDEPDFCIKNIALFKPKRINGQYLFCLMQSPFFQSYIADRLDGGIQKFISLSVLRTLLIIHPPIDEQEAIAGVLSAMDEEIAALEQRLAKTKALKQGMMQELLTGRTRLV